MIPPTTNMQHAINMVPRRPKGSEKEAKKAPQKHPAVNRATTVPDLASPLFWRKRCLKESEATTSAITPKSYLDQGLNRVSSINIKRRFTRRGMSQEQRSSQQEIGILQLSSSFRKFTFPQSTKYNKIFQGDVMTDIYTVSPWKSMMHIWQSCGIMNVTARGKDQRFSSSCWRALWRGPTRH